MIISISVVMVIGAVGFILLVAAVMVAYNVLIAKHNQVQNAFSSVDVVLKQRSDLIPNLVNTVKGYVHHEMAVLQELTALRAAATRLQTASADRFYTETKITDTIRQILAVRENYPELKSSEQFLQLMAALNDIEEHISAARRAYNAAVNDYNNSVDMFPTNLLAQLFRFERQTLFQFDSTV